jgi:cytochrome c oxidase assembly factor CtaG
MGMSTEVFVLAAEAVLVGALYLHAARRVPRWPRRRTAAFLAGLLLTFGALGMPDARLEIHMVQHLLLALVGAPLLVAGSPLALALRFAHRPVRSLLRAPVLAHPIAGWIALAAMMVVAHVPAVWDAAGHGAAHIVAHGAWLAAGVLFWRPLVGVDPVPRRPGPIGRLLLMITAMAPMGAVGSTMLDAQSAWYAGATAAQVRAAGAIMWIGGGCVLAAMTVLLGWRAVVDEHRRQLRIEQVLG